MYHKHEIVAKIGTILSFFFVGFGFIEKLLKDKKWVFYNNGKFYFYVEWNYLLYSIIGIIFCGIFWSLRYCWKYYKSKDVDMSFDDGKITIFNNSEHIINIRKICCIVMYDLYNKKENRPWLDDGFLNDIFSNKNIPSLTHFSIEPSFDEKVNYVWKTKIIVILSIKYTVLDSDFISSITRTLSTNETKKMKRIIVPETKKEIKMFKKLSQK